ncbi:hypothetical protein BC941DRAFT_361124 [Chlamydoabsidia padenii]|nr:hypothetical protein BC941DRAFT_361124 [Chlamydoabsidia padenii]
MSLHPSCHIVIINTGATHDQTAVLTTNNNNYQSRTCNITITGPHDVVMTARAELLQACPLEIKLQLKIPIKDLPTIFTDPTCHNTLFEKIRQETQARLSLSPSAPTQQSYFESENVLEITIIGLPHLAELARVRLLVALDELMNLNSDVLFIPRKLHYLVCGRKRATLQPIIDETLTNIYFPSPFTNKDTNGNSSKDDDDNSGDDKPPIYITGDPTSVSRSKDMLTKLANQKAKSIYQKNATLDHRKLDWMQIHRRDELLQIMYDNGSFIALPPPGSTLDIITVYAENRVNAERTLRSINFLACHIYEGCFYFHDHDDLYADTNFFHSISNLANLTLTLSQVSGTEVIYRADSGCIQVFGTERDVRSVYQRLHETSFLKVYHHNAVFNVELSNDQREFISGKKNGKINKIMKTSGAKIKFLPFGEYNFILEVESSNFVKALDGLTLLQEELPAEISFYVPETYHKRIIGVGGKNIQRIMKKYGVYVKFSNAEEFASLGGYYGNEDNVVARTPMKNQVNLNNLRQAVTPKDKDFVVQTFSIPFRRHRSILFDYKVYLQEVSKKTSVKIIWSSHELASNIVTLVGPQCDLDSAVQMLRHMVSDVYCFRVPKSNQLKSVLLSAAFEEQVVCRIEKEKDITVDVKMALMDFDTGDGQPSSMTSHSSSPSSSSFSSSPTSNNGNDSDHANCNDCIIPFKMDLAHLNLLSTALDIVVMFLRNHQVPLYKEISNDLIGNNTRLNGNTLTLGNYDAHLKSKLLSSALPPGKKEKKKWEEEEELDT